MHAAEPSQPPPAHPRIPRRAAAPSSSSNTIPSFGNKLTEATARPPAAVKAAPAQPKAAQAAQGAAVPAPAANPPGPAAPPASSADNPGKPASDGAPQPADEAQADGKPAPAKKTLSAGLPLAEPEPALSSLLSDTVTPMPVQAAPLPSGPAASAPVLAPDSGPAASVDAAQPSAPSAVAAPQPPATPGPGQAGPPSPAAAAGTVPAATDGAAAAPSTTEVADCTGPEEDKPAAATPAIAPDGTQPQAASAPQPPALPPSSFAPPGPAPVPPHHTPAPPQAAPPPATAFQAQAQPAAGQVGPVLASFAATASRGGEPQSLTIRLDPTDLGRVQVRIERSPDGAARVALVVEKADTLMMLLRDQPQLHQALDLAGVPSTDRTLQFQLAPPEAPAPASSGMMTAHSDHGSGSGQHRQGSPQPQRGHGNDPAFFADDTGPRATAWRRAGVDITA